MPEVNKPEAEPMPLQRSLEDEALELLTSSQAGGHAGKRAEGLFNAWRLQSASHERAAKRAEQIWLELGEQRAYRVSNRKGRPRAKYALSAAAVASLLLLLGAQSEELFADHRTMPGETLNVTLPDGSVANLNTATALDVEFDANERRIDLWAGEAAFKVKHDPARPFVVHSRQGSVTVTGTVFSVTDLGDSTNVVVAEGSVLVLPNAAQPRDLDKGKSVDFAADGIGATELVDPARELAWQDGRLVFEAMDLSQVIAELDRFYPGRFVIVGSGLSEAPITGVFKTDEPLGALEALASRFGFEVWGLPGLKFIAAR
ncbi:MAG: FecR domain-containing protein [Pseudomonadota bacterium]